MKGEKAGARACVWLCECARVLYTCICAVVLGTLPSLTHSPRHQCTVIQVRKLLADNTCTIAEVTHADVLVVDYQGAPSTDDLV